MPLLFSERGADLEAEKPRVAVPNQSIAEQG